MLPDLYGEILESPVIILVSSMIEVSDILNISTLDLGMSGDHLKELCLLNLKGKMNLILNIKKEI